MINKRKVIFKNIFINFFITLITGICSFIFNRFFLHTLGAEFNGLIRLFTQLIVYLSLAELGVGAAASYALYKPLEENNIEKLNIVFNTLKKTYNRIAGAIFLFGCLATPFIHFLTNDFEFKSIYYIYWLVYVFNTAFSYIGMRYALLLNADHKFYITRSIQGSVTICCVLLKIFFIQQFGNFNIILLIIVIETIANVLFIKLYFHKHYHFVQPTTTTDKTISKNLFYLLWHKIGSLVVFNTDYIVISKFLSLTTVTLYSNYLLLLTTVLGFLDVIINAIIPTIGRFNAKANTENSYHLFRLFFAVFFYLALLLSIIFYRSVSAFIAIWIGKDFILPQLTIILILVNFFVSISRKPVDIFSSTSGYFSDIFIPILESALNLIVSIVLVQIIGLNGVIIGTIVSNLVIVYFIKPLRFYKLVFHYHPFKYFVDASKYFFFGIVIIGIEHYIANYFVISNKTIVEWIMTTFTYSVIMVIIVTSFFLFDQYFRNFIQLLFRRNKSNAKNINS